MNTGAAYEALARSQIVREYAEAFRAATGVAVRLVPQGMVGKRVTFGGQENPFCALIGRAPGACEACLATQADAQRRLGKKLSPQHLRCFAGLTDVAVPVVIGGQHVATLLAGQVHRQKPTRRQTSVAVKQLVEWGLKTDLHLVEEAYFHTAVVSDKQFDAMVRLLTIFAKHLAEFATRCILGGRDNEPRAVVQAKDFIRSRASRRLSLAEAAAHVHVSAFYFCKMFKKATGMTFTEYVSRVRVEKAKNLLVNPTVRIGEIAFASGFQSIPHFNRVFRRYAGVSPTRYRASLDK